jgi:hypothetical protein
MNTSIPAVAVIKSSNVPFGYSIAFMWSEPKVGVYQRVGYVDVRGAERFKFDKTFAEAARTTATAI